MFHRVLWTASAAGVFSLIESDFRATTVRHLFLAFILHLSTLGFFVGYSVGYRLGYASALHFLLVCILFVVNYSCSILCFF